METERKRAGVLVLTSRETQGWHSPFSVELRRWRRAQIMSRCRQDAAAMGFREFTVYDAMETFLLQERLAE